jgi:hypothetical protein
MRQWLNPMLPKGMSSVLMEMLLSLLLFLLLFFPQLLPTLPLFFDITARASGSFLELHFNNAIK